MDFRRIKDDFRKLTRISGYIGISPFELNEIIKEEEPFFVSSEVIEENEKFYSLIDSTVSDKQFKEMLKYKVAFFTKYGKVSIGENQFFGVRTDKEGNKDFLTVDVKGIDKLGDEYLTFAHSDVTKFEVMTMIDGVPIIDTYGKYNSLKLSEMEGLGVRKKEQIVSYVSHSEPNVKDVYSFNRYGQEIRFCKRNYMRDGADDFDRIVEIVCFRVEGLIIKIIKESIDLETIVSYLIGVDPDSSSLKMSDANTNFLECPENLYSAYESNEIGVLELWSKILKSRMQRGMKKQQISMFSTLFLNFNLMKDLRKKFLIFKIYYIFYNYVC